MQSKLYPVADGTTLRIIKAEDITGAELRGIGAGGQTFLLHLSDLDLQRLANWLSEWDYCTKKEA